MSWIIYKHTNKINGKVYVGQTKQSTTDRWANGNGYRHNPYFYSAILKYGWNEGFKHEIIVSDIMTQKQANELEIYYIKKEHSYIGDKKCNGYNLTKGGENHDHLGFQVAQIDKVTHEIVQVFNTIREAETKTKNDHTLIGKCCHNTGRVNTVGGYYWAFLADFKNGQWKPRKKKTYHDKKDFGVYRLDDDLNIIAKYHSQLEAQKLTGISASNICNACNQVRGYHKPGGSYWCFVKDYDSFVPLATKQKLTPIVRINMNNLNDIKIYKSTKEAARDNKISEGAIYNAANGTTISSAGYYWCFEQEYTSSWQPRSDENKRKIICVETQTNYESITDASNILGISAANIGRACRDSGLTAGGYHWSYLEDFGPTFKIRERKTTCIKVICIDTNTTYKSATNAATVLNLDNSEISKCCKDYSRTCGGYHWAFYEDYINGKFVSKAKRVGKHGMKRVYCVELDKIFESLNYASRQCHIDSSSIGRACSGKQTVAGGYHWKFVE